MSDFEAAIELKRQTTTIVILAMVYKGDIYGKDIHTAVVPFEGNTRNGCETIQCFQPNLCGKYSLLICYKY